MSNTHLTPLLRITPVYRKLNTKVGTENSNWNPCQETWNRPGYVKLSHTALISTLRDRLLFIGFLNYGLSLLMPFYLMQLCIARSKNLKVVKVWLWRDAVFMVTVQFYFKFMRRRFFHDRCKSITIFVTMTDNDLKKIITCI